MSTTVTLRLAGSSISRGIRHGVIQEISARRIDAHRTRDRDRRSDIFRPAHHEPRRRVPTRLGPPQA